MEVASAFRKPRQGSHSRDRNRRDLLKGPFSFCEGSALVLLANFCNVCQVKATQFPMKTLMFKHEQENV